jgi:preprotein translocase subunit SecG
MIYTIIIGFIVFIAILLVLIVLAQKSKGGVAIQFGGSGASQLLGVKKSADLFEQLTWGFVVAIIILSLSSKFFLPERNNTDALKSVNEAEAKSKQVKAPVKQEAKQQSTTEAKTETKADDLQKTEDAPKKEEAKKEDKK